MKNAQCLIATLIVILLSPLSLEAQNITGRYTYDLKGVDNIKVEWIREDGYTLRTMTNDSGYYSLSLTYVKNEKSITPIKQILSSISSINGNAEIIYILPESGETEICVYDITGAEVIKFNKGFEVQGVHKTIWNLRNSLGERLTTGIYPYSIKSAGNAEFGSVAYINGLVFGSANDMKGYKNYPQVNAVKKINETPMIRFTDVSEKRTDLFHTYAAPCSPAHDTVINIKGIPYVLLPTPFWGDWYVETVKDYVQFQAIEPVGGGPFAKNLYENGPVLIYEKPSDGNELYRSTLDSAIAEINSTSNRNFFKKILWPYTGTEKRTTVILKFDPNLGPNGRTTIIGYEPVNGIIRVTSYELEINPTRTIEYEKVLSELLHELARIIDIQGSEGTGVPADVIGCVTEDRVKHLSEVDILKNKILYDADPGTIFQNYLRTAGE